MTLDQPPDSPHAHSNTQLHRDRAWAESFGGGAALYHRVRPRYPVSLVDFLMSEQAKLILDVGCGTGIVGSLFRDRDCEILGIEPDPRMAEVARQLGLTVEITPFESWQARKRQFDLLISGQAWHWVDPEIGPQRAASALKDGGRIGIFWNVSQPPPPLEEEIGRIYSEIAPQFFRYSVLFGRDTGRVETLRRNLLKDGLFSRLEHHIFKWQRDYTTDEWLEHLVTHSDHQALPAPKLRKLLNAISQSFAGLGGAAKIHYKTHLVLARRTPRLDGSVREFEKRA